MLEKIAAYEAVHAVQSWQDLKNRLDADRRFFAFFHPRMPDEPLIFVEVALGQGHERTMSVELLDETAPVGDPAVPTPPSSIPSLAPSAGSPASASAIS